MLEDRRALHDKHREMAAEAVRMEETHAEELQALRNQLVQESEARAIWRQRWKPTLRLKAWFWLTPVSPARALSLLPVR